MKNFICCIIFIFTVFAHFSYAQQTSVIDVINQSDMIEKKVVNESPSYSLMDKAINLYKEGKYSDSEKTFEFILQQDPYNRKAMEYLQRIATRVSVISEVEQQSARAQALAEIGQSWKESSKVYSIETEEDKKPIISSDDIAIQELLESMQSIRIEECEFINEEISVVLSFLAFKTREGSGKSVNFVPYGMSDLIGGQSLINIELTDPSIFEALTFITEMNNWKFEVRSNAVIVMPIDYVAAEDLKVVTYPILPEVGADASVFTSAFVGS